MKTGNLWEDFEWRRAVDGYAWVECQGGLLMVPKQNDEKPLRTTAYRPLSREHAGLFIEFAALKAEPDSVLDFANRYGQLGWPVLAHVWDGKPVSRLPPLGAFDASPFAKDDDTRPHYPGLVGEFLALTGNEVWEQRSTWAAQIRLLSEFRHNYLLLDSVPLLAPSLQGSLNLELNETVGPFVSWSQRDKTFRFRLWPHSLCGALWLQAALTLARPLTIRKCRMCSTPIEVSRSGGARTDVMFCSTACKSRDYRRRKAEARRLTDKGWKPAKIAKKLRTDASTVRKWLR